jgi:hypothetical protein
VRALLVLALIPAIAAAEAPRFTSSIYPRDALGSELARAVGTRLDGCWTRAGAIRLRIAFADGAATEVMLDESSDPAAETCVLGVLLGVPLASYSATVELRITGSDPKTTARLPIDPAILAKLSSPPPLPPIAITRREPFDRGMGLATFHAPYPGRKSEPWTMPRAEKKHNFIGRVVMTAHVDIEIGDPDIERVVRRHGGVFRACFQIHNASGRLDVALSIDSTGIPTASTRSMTVSVDALACIERSLRRLRFPATGTATTVRFPIIFFRP